MPDMCVSYVTGSIFCFILSWCYVKGLHKRIRENTITQEYYDIIRSQPITNINFNVEPPRYTEKDELMPLIVNNKRRRNSI